MIKPIKVLLVFLAASCLLLPTRLGANVTPRLEWAGEQGAGSDYPYVFPIWGDRVVAKGFDLPLPVGLMVNYFGMEQNVRIGNLKLGLNDLEPVQADFIEFDAAVSQVETVTVRPDIWVLPFLDVYGLFTRGKSQTTVKISKPFEFESKAEQYATGVGVGITGSFALGPFFAVLDANVVWTQLELLEDPVQAFLFSPRIGYSLKLDEENDMNAAFWIGTSYQGISLDTQGSVDLREVMPDVSQEKIDEWRNTYAAWYDDLSRKQQLLVDAIMAALSEWAAGRDPGGATVHYSMDKKLESPWNLLLGAQFQLDKAWQFRTEVGLFGRTSLLLSLNYRFGI